MVLGCDVELTNTKIIVVALLLTNIKVWSGGTFVLSLSNL